MIVIVNNATIRFGCYAMDTIPTPIDDRLPSPGAREERPAIRPGSRIPGPRRREVRRGFAHTHPGGEPVTVDSDSFPHAEGPDERDAAAELRDRGAERRDARARLQDASAGPDTSMEEILGRASRDRARAAADRARASDDRARAALDRREAARDRSEALELRAEAARNLKLAATDGLTGTWTRKFGLEAIRREVDRAHRTGQGIVLAFIDVDGLKRVNDVHGHAHGDALLAAVGETLRAGVRPYDVIVRYGGDEFLALMSDTSLDAARSRFAEIAVTLAAGGADRAFSVGLADAHGGETLELLIERADADLLVRRRARRGSELGPQAP